MTVNLFSIDRVERFRGKMDDIGVYFIFVVLLSFYFVLLH